MVINQWLAAAHRGDAVGDSARQVRDRLRAFGHRSDIFALTIDEDMAGEARPFSDPDARAGTPVAAAELFGKSEQGARQ